MSRFPWSRPICASLPPFLTLHSFYPTIPPSSPLFGPSFRHLPSPTSFPPTAGVVAPLFLCPHPVLCPHPGRSSDPWSCGRPQLHWGSPCGIRKYVQYLFTTALISSFLYSTHRVVVVPTLRSATQTQIRLHPLRVSVLTHPGCQPHLRHNLDDFRVWEPFSFARTLENVQDTNLHSRFPTVPFALLYQDIKSFLIPISQVRPPL